MTNINYSDLVASLIERKRTFEALGIRTMDEEDFAIAEEIASIIPAIKPNIGINGHILSLNTALRKGYSSLHLLDPTYANRVDNGINDVEFLSTFDVPFCFKTYVQYAADSKTNEVDKTSGIVKHFKIPKSLDEVSPMWFAHEFIHFLKETHYEEYIDGQVLGDVIPMFFELLIADKVKREHEVAFLQNRLFLLKNECYLVERVKTELPDDLYDVFATSSLQYLNSYYYSLRLFELYKADKKKSKIYIILTPEDKNEFLSSGFNII